MLRRVALVNADVSEEPAASIIRVTRIGELRTLAVNSNRDGRCEEILILLTQYFFPACVGSYLWLTLFLVYRFLSP
jgi:hypothetical protein